MLISVPDDETNGAACRFPLKHTTEQFYLVQFLSASCDATLSRASPVQFMLNEVKIHQNACGHSVDNASDSLTMTFAKSCQPEYLS
jgi:hypothetical protein